VRRISDRQMLIAAQQLYAITMRSALLARLLALYWRSTCNCPLACFHLP
jgi:hypothetical protein